MDRAIGKCREWFIAQTVPAETRLVCPSRDVFQGRLENMHRAFSRKTKDDGSVALLTAVAGEIGNNCFDHNLGQWQDVLGCYFDCGHHGDFQWVVIADRGQGVRSSLKTVVPSVQDDEEALEIAFHRKVSGRSPEKRGNGLKFVRSVINGHPDRSLHFTTGKATRTFGGLTQQLESRLHGMQVQARGTFSCLFWKIV